MFPYAVKGILLKRRILRRGGDLGWPTWAQSNHKGSYVTKAKPERDGRLNAQIEAMQPRAKKPQLTAAAGSRLRQGAEPRKPPEGTSLPTPWLQPLRPAFRLLTLEPSENKGVLFTAPKFAVIWYNGNGNYFIEVSLTHHILLVSGVWRNDPIFVYIAKWSPRSS